MAVSAPIEKKHELVLKRINNDHFQGRTNRHFRAILAIIWDEMALQVCLHSPNAPSRLPKSLVDRFLVSYLKSMCSRAQRVNYAQFVRGRTYHFSTVFGEYSGLNSSSRISVHCNSVQ